MITIDDSIELSKNFYTITVSFSDSILKATSLPEIFDNIINGTSENNATYHDIAQSLMLSYEFSKLINSEMNITEDSDYTKLSLSFGIDTYSEIEISESEDNNEGFVSKNRYKALKILVVDDERLGRATMKRYLQFYSEKVIFAVDGFDAIVQAKNHRPDLILMDIMMPGKDGYETFNEIRKFDSTTPIIALTAVGMKEDFDKIKQHGFDELLSKPIDENKLIEVFNKVVE